MRLPESLPGIDPQVVLTPKEFAALLEYSTTLPTGPEVGFRWKRDINARRYPRCGHLHVFDGTRQPDFIGPEWWMGEAVPDPDPKFVCIVWRRIVVKAA